MILFPAIDLKEGKVVRLAQGDYDQVTQYSQDPLEQAKVWADQGAEWLHMVDLDGAREGRPVNLESIRDVVEKTHLKVEVGGGIRDDEMGFDIAGLAEDLQQADAINGTAGTRHGDDDSSFHLRSG